MPVNFKRTCHAVQRKQTTCWDLNFCKQNDEKHNHGRRQGQGPATKERQLISDSVVTVLQIGIQSFTITLSRAAELWGKRLKIIFSLRHRRLSSSGRCCLVRTKKNILIFWQNSKLQSRDWHISTILLILAFTTESSLALSRWTSCRFLVVTMESMAWTHFGFNLDGLPRKLSWNERVAL